MGNKNVPEKDNRIWNNTTIIAVIGLIGTIATAYFGYLANVKPTELSMDATQTANAVLSPYLSPSPISATQTVSVSATPYFSPTPTSVIEPANDTANQSLAESFPISFLPIENKDQLVKTFELDGSGTRANIRFIANSFDLDFKFAVPLDARCGLLVYSLLKHFALEKYVVVDWSQYPQAGGAWRPVWGLIINGREVIRCESEELSAVGLNDGDLIGLKIEWTLTTTIDSNEYYDANTTPEPTNTPAPRRIPPPDIFP